jgi:hypothetical protein
MNFFLLVVIAAILVTNAFSSPVFWSQLNATYAQEYGGKK